MDDTGQVFLLPPEMLSCPEVAKGCYTVIASVGAHGRPSALGFIVQPQILHVNGGRGGSLCNVSKCKHNCKVSNATAEV